MIGCVAIVATLGGAYSAIKLAEPAPQEKTTAVKYDHLKLEHVSVPRLKNGEVNGYVIGMLSATVKADEIAARRQAVASHISSAAFRVIYGEPEFDFKALKPAQIGKLSERIAAEANKSMGAEAVKQVIVENINYVKPDELRNLSE